MKALLVFRPRWITIHGLQQAGQQDKMHNKSNTMWKSFLGFVGC